MKKNASELHKEFSKKKFDPVYIFYGTEDFIIEELTNSLLKNALNPGDQDFNLDMFYANEIEGSQIVNAAMSFPMMAERRVVVVKHIDQLAAKDIPLLAKYIQRPSPSTCLALTSKTSLTKSGFSAIKKNCTTVETKPLYDNQIPAWVRTYLTKYNLTISEEAIRLLHASTGNNLRNIASEIEKIKLILGETTQIEVKHIEAIVGTSREYNIFELCDSIGLKNIEKSLRILSRMLQLGEQPTGIIAMINRHFVLLSKIKDMKATNHSNDAIAKTLKVHPFFVSNYITQSGKYNRTQLGKTFSFLLQADYQLKSSYQKPKLILETLLFQLSMM